MTILFYVIAYLLCGVVFATLMYIFIKLDRVKIDIKDRETGEDLPFACAINQMILTWPIRLIEIVLLLVLVIFEKER